MAEENTGQFFPDDQFIRAFTESQSALRGFCSASIGNPEDARDVFQKVCLVLWKKVGDWDPDTPFLKWAFAVARFEILAYVRDESRDRLVFDEDVVLAMTNTTERLAEKQVDRRDALEKCLAKLKPYHRGSPHRPLRQELQFSRNRRTAEPRSQRRKSHDDAPAPILGEARPPYLLWKSQVSIGRNYRLFSLKTKSIPMIGHYSNRRNRSESIYQRQLCPPYGGTSFIGQNSFDS